ncbi:MAG: lipoprotein insertase outer membrane protein LolB [Steroidobacter sp.]
MATRYFSLVVLLLLGGCVTQPPRETIHDIKDVSQLRDWSAQGRIGITGVAQAGSGAFAWQQKNSISQVHLHGPLNTGSVYVLLDDTLHLTLGNGEHYDADAALDVLSAQLGTAIPVRQMSYWLRGVPAPGAYQWSSAGGRVLQQDGWHIEYGDTVDVNGLLLPKRITATRDAVRIRVVISQWQLQ